jgi:hypothetical protein
MRKFLSIAVMAGLALSTGLASAASGVALLVPVAFEEGAHANPSVKEDCDLEGMVQRDFLNVLKRTSVGGETTSSVAGGKVLKVLVGRQIGVPGGFWTGPKSITVRLQFFDDGKMLRSTSMSSETMHFAPFSGTCSIIRHASTKLAKAAAKWADTGQNDSPAAAEPAASAGEGAALATDAAK